MDLIYNNNWLRRPIVSLSHGTKSYRINRPKVYLNYEGILIESGLLVKSRSLTSTESYISSAAGFGFLEDNKISNAKFNRSQQSSHAN